MSCRRILLVDDESYVTSVVSSKLRRGGDEVFVANDGQEALAIAIEQLPELVVSDFQMPVMDGFELARALKSDARTCQIPVFLLTARGHLLSPGQLAETNIRQLLAKPFSTRELLEAIDETLPTPAQ